MRTWRSINYRYFVQENDNGWGICDSEMYKYSSFFSHYIPSGEVWKVSSLREYIPQGHMPLVDALEMAIRLNEALR